MALLTQPDHILMAGALESEEPHVARRILARPRFDPNNDMPTTTEDHSHGVLVLFQDRTEPIATKVTGVLH